MKKATTLIEVVVYGMLLLTVLSLAYSFFKLGSGYFQKTRAQIELQQQAALTGASLVRDLCEASAGSVVSFPNGTAVTAPAGLVFLSARNAAGTFCYEAASGRPIWQSYVGYYLDVDPEFAGDTRVRALYRAEVTNKGGLPSTQPVTPTAAGVTTQWIQINGINRHLIAHGLSPQTATSPHGGLDAYNLTSADLKTYPALLGNPIWIDLGLTNPAFKGHEFRSRLAVMARD